MEGGGGLFMKSGTGKCGWVGVSSLVPKAGGEDILTVIIL